MRTIAIIGSTGSIGTQTLDVVRANADIRVGALAAGNNIELLEKQVREFKPALISVQSEDRANELGNACDSGTSDYESGIGIPCAYSSGRQ